MSREFRLPSLGSGLKEAQLISWKVKSGDRVESAQVLCEVETEKSLIEVPVPFAGIVERLGVEAGSSINVGDVLVVINDGRIVDAAPAATAPAKPEDREPASKTHAAPAPKSAGNGRVRAMPSVRRIAKEHGVDLASVTGTGPRGAVLRSDVLAAHPPERPEAPAARRVKLGMMRRTIAEHMARSWREIPHVFARMEVDAEPMLEARRALSARGDGKFPLEAILIRAVLPVLARRPEFNATLDEHDLILHDRHDIGIAVDTPDGLVVPVLCAAGESSALELGRTLADLLARAVTRKTRPDEMAGATFTVNNIGALGLTRGTSIIPYGTTSILSLARAVARPAWREGRVIGTTVAELTLSFDHRVIDGGMAARFLEDVRANLEQPLRVLL
jgi:pyruvate/2-oxoglutarate dehydrogenase complex dihydrolipoamide acyltransferase (E2) component